MELDERKIKILNSIIQTYLITGEPVGSRTISKYTDLNLSSATIRNEMSDLEDLGYIIQPHTSAGRIPSDKGYRFYVDNLMKEKIAEVDEMKDILIEKADKLDHLLKHVAKLLAANTNYATMISAPQYKRNKLKFIQLSRVEESQLLVVVMLEGNLIKNRLIEVDERVSEDEVAKLNMLINNFLQGLNLQHKRLNYPELGYRENARELLYMMEEKQAWSELIVDQEVSAEENKNPIQIYIGSESPVSTMKDCSIVTATYELEEGVQGTIGIIGPKRMDYKKVVGNLQTMMNQLDDIFKKK